MAMATEAGEGEIGDGQRGSTGKRWTLTGKRTPNWAGADIVERSPHPCVRLGTASFPDALLLALLILSFHVLSFADDSAEIC